MDQIKKKFSDWISNRPVRELNHLKESPFYFNFLNRHRIFDSESNWDDRNIEKWIGEMPIVNRSDLETDLISKFLVLKKTEKLNPVWSSGTTGQPICVYRNWKDDLRFWNLLFNLGMIKITPQLSVLFLCSLSEGREYRSQEKFDFFKLDLVRLNSHKTDESRISSLEPDIISTSPSGLAWLLKNPGHLQRPTLKLIYSTALPYDRDLFEAIKKETNARLVHAYSTTETGPIGYYCLIANHYHVFSDIYLETVNESILVSKLFPSALPLLRYRTGDQGEIIKSDCLCGFHGTSLDSLQGRKAAFPDSADQAL